ncbi:hypothetical protein Tco_1268772 [Tanacetum coccineum]
MSGNDTKAAGADIRPTYDTDSLEHVDKDDYNVFSMQKEHHEQPKSVNDTYLVEQCDINTTHDSSNMSNNGREAGQDDDLKKEREWLAFLNEQMKIETEGSKQNNKALELSNKALREANTEYYYADHMNAILGVYTTLDEHSDLACNYLEALEKCERLKKGLSKRTENVKNKSFNELSKRFSELEKHSINLELALQQCQEKSKNYKV